jgi:hypothetical protein
MVQLPRPVHPILQKHEDDILLYEALLGPVLGDLVFATSILSDVQHALGVEPQIVEQINEAKALILRASNFAIKA